MKGVTLTADTLPKRLKRDIQVAAQRRKQDPIKAVEDYVAAHNKRYRVVAIDESAPEGRREIIAEELQQRIINRLGSNGRRVMGHLVRLSKEERAQVLASFNQDGSVRNPFKVV